MSEKNNKSVSYSQIAKRTRNNNNVNRFNASSNSGESRSETRRTNRDNDPKEEPKNIVLNDNVFYLISTQTIEAIRNRLLQYAESPEDIGIIKIILDGENSDLLTPSSINPSYNQGTLILMKPYIFEKIRKSEDKFFSKLNYYFINPAKIEKMKLKSLFFTLPLGEVIEKSVSMNKIKEVLDSFKRLGLLSELPEVKLNTLRDPQYQKNNGTITFKDDTDPNVIESIKLFLNRMQVSIKQQDKVIWAAILCKNNDPEYRKGRRRN
jgi:hypothetical protein